MKADYPTLADKMRPALVNFSKIAENVKKYLTNNKEGLIMAVVRIFLKCFLYLMLFNLAGCANFFMMKTLEENLLDLENGAVAAVISGCGLLYAKLNFFSLLRFKGGRSRLQEE